MILYVRMKQPTQGSLEFSEHIKMKLYSLIATILFAIVGLINFAPLMGIASDAMLTSLYAVEVSSPDMSLLLRHRAALFGIVGGYILFAAFRPTHRPVATVMAFASMVSFLALYLMIGPENNKLIGVFRIDIVAVVLLAAAVLLDRRNKSGTRSQ